MWTKLWTGGKMYKLKNKQLIHLKKGKHHDGGGLYIRITKQGKGLWTYRFRINKKSHEMSLGTFPEVKISEAREKLAEQKRLRLKDINPLHEKRKHEILKEQQNKKFSEIADLYITTKKKTNGLILKVNNNGEVLLKLMQSLF